MDPQESTANIHAVTKDTATRTEYSFCNEKGEPIHRSQVIYKNEPKIIVYPFSYSQARGLTKKKINEIEFRGWPTLEELPKLIRPSTRITLSHKKVAPVMRALYARNPKLSKLIFTKNGKSRITPQTATFLWEDFEKVCRLIGKEINLFEARRRFAVATGLADISSTFEAIPAALTKGGLTHLLEPYGQNIALSQTDTEVLLELINHVPLGSVTVTANFIQTKNKVNVAYLENVIEGYEGLLTSKNDNEKEWQSFFDKHAWMLVSVFPYQVILFKKEAYVGGKTIEDSEGRVVDFLFQNGFRDNYALLEVKTHNKSLLKAVPYRAPDAYAQHNDCSGAISQCLDQKSTFLTEMGQKYKSLDPKVVLIIGKKSSLNDNQSRAFELLRSNQKNVDIVTFDEVLEKIKGLRSILQKGD